LARKRVRRFTDKDKRSSTFLLLAVEINDLGRRRRKKREEAPALVDRAARLVGVLLMLELKLVLVLQIHKLAAGALGSIDTTKREKIKDSGMEALCPPPRRNALFCLYLVHVTKGAESKSDE
jgi:hypothetical protein